ncbi:hypothetical protein BMIN10S_02868 [Bosea minatitlanensis]
MKELGFLGGCQSASTLILEIGDGLRCASGRSAGADQGFVPGGRKGKRGPRTDNRKFLDALLWMAHSGGRWRDLPERLGDYQSVKRRYHRWIAMGVLDDMLAALARGRRSGMADDRLHHRARPPACGRGRQGQRGAQDPRRQERNRIERFFDRLKQFRRVATRYDKLLANFMGDRAGLDPDAQFAGSGDGVGAQFRDQRPARSVQNHRLLILRSARLENTGATRYRL